MNIKTKIMFHFYFFGILKITMIVHKPFNIIPYHTIPDWAAMAEISHN